MVAGKRLQLRRVYSLRKLLRNTNTICRRNRFNCKSCDDGSERTRTNMRRRSYVSSTITNEFDVVVSDLSVTFRDSHDEEKRVLRNVNLQVPKGSMYMILGLNGSGKVGKVSLCCSYNRDDAEHNPNTTTPLCAYLLISYCIVL